MAIFLLLENGNIIELEDNSGQILLENQINNEYTQGPLDNFSNGLGFTFCDTKTQT